MKTNLLVNTKIHSPCLSTKINLTSSKMNFSWELHYRWLQHRVWLVSSATTKDEAGAQNLKTNDAADVFTRVSWALTTNSDQQRCHSLSQHFFYLHQEEISSIGDPGSCFLDRRCCSLSWSVPLLQVSHSLPPPVPSEPPIFCYLGLDSTASQLLQEWRQSSWCF